MAQLEEISIGTAELINKQSFLDARNMLGEHCARILGYFKEDGEKSVAQIEEALREADSRKLVLPAHTLKGEASQFGADRLALLAETIEITARHYVETHQDPGELVEEIVQLRPLFEQSIGALEAEISPLVKRSTGPVGFGRRQ